MAAEWVRVERRGETPYFWNRADDSVSWTLPYGANFIYHQKFRDMSNTDVYFVPAGTQFEMPFLPGRGGTRERSRRLATLAAIAKPRGLECSLNSGPHATILLAIMRMQLGRSDLIAAIRAKPYQATIDKLFDVAIATRDFDLALEFARFGATGSVVNLTLRDFATHTNNSCIPFNRSFETLLNIADFSEGVAKFLREYSWHVGRRAYSFLDFVVLYDPHSHSTIERLRKLLCPFSAIFQLHDFVVDDTRAIPEIGINPECGVDHEARINAAILAGADLRYMICNATLSLWDIAILNSKPQLAISLAKVGVCSTCGISLGCYMLHQVSTITKLALNTLIVKSAIVAGADITSFRICPLFATRLAIGWEWASYAEHPKLREGQTLLDIAIHCGQIKYAEFLAKKKCHCTCTSEELSASVMGLGPSGVYSWSYEANHEDVRSMDAAKEAFLVCAENVANLIVAVVQMASWWSRDSGSLMVLNRNVLTLIRAFACQMQLAPFVTLNNHISKLRYMNCDIASSCYHGDASPTATSDSDDVYPTPTPTPTSTQTLVSNDGGNHFLDVYPHIEALDESSHEEISEPAVVIDPAEAEIIANERWASWVSYRAQQDSSIQGLVSNDGGNHFLLLTFSRHERRLEEAILESGVACRALAEGVNLLPDWARGAKILHGAITPESVDTSEQLGAYHVILHVNDEEELLAALQTLPYNVRKLKPGCGRVFLPDELSHLNLSSNASCSKASVPSSTESFPSLDSSYELIVKYTFIHIKPVAHDTRTAQTW